MRRFIAQRIEELLVKFFSRKDCLPRNLVPVTRTKKRVPSPIESDTQFWFDHLSSLVDVAWKLFMTQIN